MKKVFLLVVIMFLTGCGAKYQLTINKDSIEEQIDFSLYKRGIINEDVLEFEKGSDEYIDSLVASDIEVFSDNYHVFYQKDVNRDGTRYDFSLYYKYNNDEYANSRTVNECFENHNVSIDDDRTLIHLSGLFRCYDDEPIEIEVKTDRFVKKTNGHKNGSTYSWTIDDSNYTNVDLYIEVTNESKARNFIYKAIAIIAGAGILLAGVYYIGTLMGRNGVNDI